MKHEIANEGWQAFLYLDSKLLAASNIRQRLGSNPSTKLKLNLFFLYSFNERVGTITTKIFIELFLCSVCRSIIMYTVKCIEVKFD